MTSTPSLRQRSALGFTLIEVLITMAIVAILSAIAIPSYGAYTRKAHRADAQQFMMDMALRQGEIMLDSRSYATKAEMALLMPVPANIARFYTVTSEPTTAPTGFLIKAVAVGNQTKDGDLTLSNTGIKTPSDKW